MSTDGGGSLNALLYLLVLLAALVTAQQVLGPPEHWLVKPRRGAVALWLLVAVPSVIGLAWHPLFTALSRQPHAIRRGQIWRLVTSVVVQDGGVGGTVFNLAALALILAAAGRIWGSATTWWLFVVGTVFFDVMTTVASPSPGGGNSATTFFLAASITGLTASRRRTPIAGGAAAATAVAGGVLLALLDAHGEVVVAGLVVGALLAQLGSSWTAMAGGSA